MRRVWPVLALLGVAVLLPTAWLLWFVNEAANNQRHLVRQRLMEAYRSQASLLRDRLEAYWETRAAALDRNVADAAPPATFAAMVRGGIADAAICLGRDGSVTYPAPPRMTAPPSDREWLKAQSLEATDRVAAAQAYAVIARTASRPEVVTHALRAEARCLMLADKKDAAAARIREMSASPAMAPDLLLFAMQMMPAGDPRATALAQRLGARLNDYASSTISAGERLFLMRELRARKIAVDLPTLEAEALAAQFVEANPAPKAEAVLHAGAPEGTWTLGSPGGRVIALFRTPTVQQEVARFVASQALPKDLRLSVSPPGAAPPRERVLEYLPAGARLPGWQLALALAGPEPFDELAARQRSLYLWIGLLVAGAVGILAAAAAWVIRRQLRLAGLKADLVAAVSHELKTPLSSMRLLVDTLLDESVPADPLKTREYLALISRENARLSRLIENFLMFSRIERNQYVCQLAETQPAGVVRGALDAIGEKLQECKVDVDVAPRLPAIRADEGALVAVLVNLLDNAFKYTAENKQIRVRAFSDNGRVCFQVADNGIGLTPKEVKKIFRKFYRVDQRLARQTGGCGLGLAIAEFIVSAHGGSIAVESRPGAGATFTVAVPRGAAYARQGPVA